MVTRMPHKSMLACWIWYLAACIPHTASSATTRASSHTSNWAVLVATSKYWYNYRHMANTLSFYRTVKRLGIPDSNIILMLAEDVACNPRNAYPGQVFNDESHRLNVYGDNVEVDYRGYEVTVENFIRVLTGRHDPAVPRPKRMLSDRGSNVLIYISGHGGNEFMKFQDTQELMAQDVADAIQQMYEKGRYRELLLVVETCQAATLYSRISSPNVLAMASSLKGESSYSHLTDMDVGLSLIDRFTWSSLDFFEKVDIHSKMTLSQLMEIYRYEVLDSHFHYDASHYPHQLDQVPVTDFFGSVSSIQHTPKLNNTAGEETLLQDDDKVAAVAGCETTAAEGKPAAAAAAMAAASGESRSAKLLQGEASNQHSDGISVGSTEATYAGGLAGRSSIHGWGKLVAGPVKAAPRSVIGPGVYVGLTAMAGIVVAASFMHRRCN